MHSMRTIPIYIYTYVSYTTKGLCILSYMNCRKHCRVASWKNGLEILTKANDRAFCHRLAAQPDWGEHTPANHDDGPNIS